ncbi:NYN domain-containing protein [Spiroplasma sp. ChiS]|uniref:NYN domain-containing protein n=1 Tax=Spiroplasma sp. ChiS TaxID=2099885 RepID=UPI001F4546A1|nr:NYN domain-containing protein [Spiroplasma sp. ChiS]
MEWLKKDYVDCFCLATSNLDFAPIVRRIKQKNKTVIGVGVIRNAEDYKKLYHWFISVDKILKAKTFNDKKELVKNNSTKSNETKELTKAKEDLIRKVDLIIKENDSDSKGFVQFSVIIENLYKKVSNFKTA